jgi:DNA-binding transcriptional LysR family regulator
LVRVDLVTLSLFIAVAEETSLAKAAEREHLAASAISKRLIDLEHNLNVKLFDRRPNGMCPTVAGSALLSHARLIMRNVDELEAEISDFAGGLRGTIRVQSNATAMACYLPEDLRTFVALYPQVRVELEEGTSPDTLRAVAENAADIGIYGDVIVPSDLDSHLYRLDRLALLVPLDHPLADRETISFIEAVGFNFVGTPKGSSIDTTLLRAASEIGATLKMNIRTSGFDVISRMVGTGLGIAVTPASVAGLYTPSSPIKALRLSDPWAERRLMISTRRADSLAPATAAFLAHLTASRPQ